MKGFLKFIVFVLVILAGLFIGRNMIAKAAVENGVRLLTGLQLSMQSLNIGVGEKPSLGIQALKLRNPKGFSDPYMVDLPEFFVAYDIAPLFKGKIHLPEVRVYLKEFVVVKNKAGEVNIDKLMPKKGAQQAKPAEKKPTGKAPQFQIGQMTLRVDKVVFRDYTTASIPVTREFKVNLNESFSNINDPTAVVSLIIAKALMNTTIASLTDIDLGALQASVADTLANSQKAAADALLKGQAAIGEQTKAAQELMGSASESLKGTVSSVTSLKDKIKLPFGKSE